jgi:hypothetical protein
MLDLLKILLLLVSDLYSEKDAVVCEKTEDARHGLLRDSCPVLEKPLAQGRLGRGDPFRHRFAGMDFSGIPSLARGRPRLLPSPFKVYVPAV